MYDTPHIGYWELLPRLVVPAILLALGLWLAALFPNIRAVVRRWSALGGLAVLAALVGTLVAAFYPHGRIANPSALSAEATVAQASRADAPQNWEFYGRNAAGTRFAPYDQITPANVSQLKVAWVYRTGRRIRGTGFGTDEDTPQQSGNVLISCAPANLSTALYVDTGL